MQKIKTLLLALIIILIGNAAMAQVNSNTGQIEVEAIFKEVIVITVKDNNAGSAKVKFVVDEINEYRNGLISEDKIDFSVASSVDYRVEMKAENTHFTSQTTSHKIDADNFMTKIEAIGNYKDDVELDIVAGGQPLGTGGLLVRGKAGDDSDNAFKMSFELGTEDVREESEHLGSLLSQNIPPATYINTVILTASAK